MRYFGEPWDAPVCNEGEQVPTPVGSQCEQCHKAIEDGDRGLMLVMYSEERDFPVHLSCLFNSIGLEFDGTPAGSN